MHTVHPDAKIGANVTVEPFAYIAGDVVIGDDCWIGPGAVIHDGARIGKGCRIHTAASVSCLPQDLKFAGEVTTGRDRRLQRHPRVRDHQPRHGIARQDGRGRPQPADGLRPHRPRRRGGQQLRDRQPRVARRRGRDRRLGGDRRPCRHTPVDAHRRRTR